MLEGLYALAKVPDPQRLRDAARVALIVWTEPRLSSSHLAIEIQEYVFFLKGNGNDTRTV